MAQSFARGDKAKWNWDPGTGTGEIAERYASRVTRTIESAEITRNASEDEPACLIGQEDRSKVLKSVTELEHA